MLVKGGPGDTIWHQEILINIGSSNGLLPDGRKPLPEPILTSARFDGIQLRWISQWEPKLFFLYDEFDNHTFKIAATFLWSQWVNKKKTGRHLFCLFFFCLSISLRMSVSPLDHTEAIDALKINHFSTLMICLLSWAHISFFHYVAIAYQFMPWNNLATVLQVTILFSGESAISIILSKMELLRLNLIATFP